MSNRAPRQTNDKDADSQAPSALGQEPGKATHNKSSSATITSPSRDLSDDEADSGQAKRARNEGNHQSFSSPSSTTSSSRQFLNEGSPSGLITSGKCIMHLIYNTYHLIKIILKLRK